MDALTCPCQSRALQSSEINDPGMVEASDRGGSHSTTCPPPGANQKTCVARPSELTTADSEDSGKSAVPTADGTILKLKPACKGKCCLGCESERSFKGMLWICQPKHTGFENSVFSL